MKYTTISLFIILNVCYGLGAVVLPEHLVPNSRENSSILPADVEKSGSIVGDEQTTDTTIPSITVSVDPPVPSTVKPNSTTTLAPKTTTITTSTTITPTTTVNPNITTTAPTPAPNSTTIAPTKPTTIKPHPNVTTTALPVTTSSPPPNDRKFDGPSFIGGIVLASGLIIIGFVAFKVYKSQAGRNYHTL